MAVAAVVALAVAGCGGTGDDATPGTDADLKGQTLEVAAVWSGTEQKNFEAVLKGFEQKTGAKVTYTSTGDKISEVLTPRISGGKAPDIAVLPQPGLLNQFAKDGSIKPVNADVAKAVDDNYAPVWKDLGSVDGKLYGVWFKAANKSTVWYQTKAFTDAGVEEPKTWEEFLKVSQTIANSGKPAVSIAGADGWTLTDWFENVYLSQAGPEMYDKLTTHEIPWTDPSVKKALTTLGELWGKSTLIAPGSAQTDFPTSVKNVFAADKAAMVYEGDFVAGVISGETKAKVGEDAKFFSFPQLGEKPSVVGGGDVAVAFKDSKAAMALMAYLASPESAEPWAKAGGLTSPNKNFDAANYPDDTTRDIAKAIGEASDAGNFRFDMSDLAPPAFGGTPGKGEWKALQDFLAAPTTVDATAAKLEAEAAAAYK
ncbi:MAG TPA: extracellular solute-binding protein [Cryptosporangiaceae bacterium]|nr:extracellular solute-binding protein [Cryptosporangiaceae bacterium]